MSKASDSVDCPTKGGYLLHKQVVFLFGTGVRWTSGKRTRSGGFSLTWIEVHSEEEANEVRERAKQIGQEMMQSPGLISSANIVTGHRLITTTAWVDAEAQRQLPRGGAYREGMDRFFGTDIAAAATIMDCIPDRLSPLWVRCTECGRMADYDQGPGKCKYGQLLTGHPPYL